MKLVSRAAALTVSTAAALAVLAPAAGAATSPDRVRTGLLKICVLGLDRGDEADVDVSGRVDFSRDIRGCDTFRVPRGVYDIEVDEPSGYRLRDDDATVRVRTNQKTTVRFFVDDRDDDCDDFWCDDDEDGDGPRIIRVDEDENCPRGYHRAQFNDEICIRND